MTEKSSRFINHKKNSVFSPENCNGGPMAQLTVKQEVVLRNLGVILTPKSLTANFASLRNHDIKLNSDPKI
jgi:hypothetical protein